MSELNEKIKNAHEKNKNLQKAFADFFELRQTPLNPNIRPPCKKRKFTRRNVIAAEVEKVIDALASKSFSRQEFLKSLDKLSISVAPAWRKCSRANSA